MGRRFGLGRAARAWFLPAWLVAAAVPPVGCYSSAASRDDGSPEVTDEGDAESVEMPSCLVDVLFVLDPRFYGSGFSCGVFNASCSLADYVAFDARLAVGGVRGYHAGSVFSIGDHAWFPESTSCWSYAGVTPGELYDPAGSPCRPGGGGDLFPVRWAEGPGSRAAEGLLLLTLFGLPCEGREHCYPVVEPLKVIRPALTPPLADGPNAGMFRDEALLVVVFLIPRDDCSVADPSVYESYPDWPSNCGVAPEWEGWLLDVEETATFLDEAKDGRVAVALWGGADGVPTEVIGPDGVPRWVPLCDIAEMQFVLVAPRLHRFLRTFGARSLFVNACDVPFIEFLPRLADFVVEQLPAECRAGR